ncbi:hypothetical protein AB3N04_00345 (plasmid) [Alkalihalophilus sp. As8PL]|uniref:Phage protein n=1 Tax=Alkalihalophilus sp. As8PL TaxID=3237103 RepID=A0AB39BNV5_9BACI
MNTINQDVIDQLWNEACELAEKEQYIVTLKSRKKSPVIEITNDYIRLQLENGNSDAKIRKDHFVSVLGTLNDKKKIQQRDTKGTEERYVLGLMSMMPYFERKVTGATPNYFITLRDELIQKLLVNKV